MSLGHKGMKFSDEHKRNIGLAKVGEKNYAWKAEKVAYNTLHNWVIYWKGNPDTCEMCGNSGFGSHQIHWANIDHKYRRVLDDYIRLCVGCHNEYDKKLKKKL